MTPEDPMTPTRGPRREAIEKALRSFEWIDVGNHPGDDEQYAEVAIAIDAFITAAEQPDPIGPLRAAWLDPGPRPDLHRAAKRQLRTEWRTLYDSLVALFGGPA